MPWSVVAAGVGAAVYLVDVPHDNVSSPVSQGVQERNHELSMGRTGRCRCGVSRETALATSLAHKRALGRFRQRLYYFPASSRPSLTPFAIDRSPMNQRELGMLVGRLARVRPQIQSALPQGSSAAADSGSLDITVWLVFPMRNR